MKKFVVSSLLLLMIPTTAVAKGGFEARVAALEAGVATLQSDVTALESGQAVNVTAIAANAAAIAANAAAIAADAAAIATNSEAIATLDGRVTVNEQGISSIAARLSTLESWLEESYIPTYNIAAELPTDGSELLAFFQPEGGIYEPVNEDLIAHQWLMVFDGVSTVLEHEVFTDADGFGHAFPAGWYPAAGGAGELEGLVPVSAIVALDSVIYNTTGSLHFGKSGTSVGVRIQEIASMLSEYLSSATYSP